LSAHDDKRYILENHIDTLAWGFYRVGIEKELLEHVKKLGKLVDDDYLAW
jgi:hypothetical protein